MVGWGDRGAGRGDGDAVRHLFRVAAGLDSLVPGEAQILAQIRDAYASAFEWGATGPVSNRHPVSLRRDEALEVDAVGSPRDGLQTATLRSPCAGRSRSRMISGRRSETT